jgi:hypothetical protein
MMITLFPYNCNSFYICKFSIHCEYFCSVGGAHLERSSRRTCRSSTWQTSQEGHRIIKSVYLTFLNYFSESKKEKDKDFSKFGIRAQPLPPPTRFHPFLIKSMVYSLSHFEQHFKGTVRPDWICMRVVSLESPLKAHQPL